MQQHSSQRSSTHGAKGEMDGLLAELRRVLERIAQIGPPETVTVPLALPMELAELMVVQAQRMGVETPHIYTSCLLHGQIHSAIENEKWDDVAAIARMIRRMSDVSTWQEFLERHPEVRQLL